MITATKKVVAFFLLLATLLPIITTATSSVRGSFRRSLPTLTINDLPDLDKEQPNTLDDIDALIGAPVPLASIKNAQPHGEPTAAELSSFQQFLAATTPQTTSVHVMDESDAGSFSGSGDDVVAGFNAYITRAVGSSVNVAVTIESITESPLSLRLDLSSNGDVVNSLSMAGVTTAALPQTFTTTGNFASNLEFDAKIVTLSSGGSDNEFDIEFKQDTSVSGTFDVSTSVTNGVASVGFYVASNIDSYTYLVYTGNTRPTVAQVLSTGAQVSVSSSGQKTQSVTLTSNPLGFGNYNVFIVQSGNYDGVVINIGTVYTVTYTSPCAASPCQHNGVCTATSGSAYTCDCSATDYTGTTCGTKIDNCASSPCRNGGTCIDGVRNYTCSCATGYTGTNCTTNIDDCASSPCLNGGTCVDGINSFTCQCSSAWTGYLCQVTSSTKCLASPCLNGGTCTNITSSPWYICSCSSAYVGDNCETATSGGGRPESSVRVVQTLSVPSITPEEYPTFKTNYAGIVCGALGISASRFSWVYFGPKRTTTNSHGFMTLAQELEAQFDLLADTSSNSTSSPTPAELFADLKSQISNPNSTFSQSAQGVVTVSAQLQSCPDGSQQETCPTSVASSSSSSTGTIVSEEPSGSNSNSTWIALGVAVGAFFAIVAALICWCQRKRPQRINQTDHAGYGGLLGGNQDLHIAFEEAHAVELQQRQDVILSPGQAQANDTHIH